MDAAAPSRTGLTSRATYSCVRCADRKVKCDRQQPCGPCIKHDAECVFRPMPPPRKRRKRVKDDILNDRLKHYEALLQERGIDSKTVSDISEVEESRDLNHMHNAEVDHTPQLLTPASIASEPGRCITKTQLLHHQGRSKFVDNGLWTRVVEQFSTPEEALEDSSCEASDTEKSEDAYDYVLGVLPRTTTTFAHPPVERIHELWQIFVENVDPLTKLVHVPTLRPQVLRATSDLKSLSRSFEALLFAIYGAAVMSLKESECEHRFGEPRKALLSQYISATKAALSRAKLMGTTNIVLLQALVLHLVSVRDIYDPRTMWTLSGVAMRIAEGMGLHRDGSSLGLPTFDSEIRRRVWWQLKMHDARTAELSGLAKFRDFNADLPKRPININDEELYPGMSTPASESTKPTDMIFCVLRSELGNFLAKHAARFGQQGKDGCLRNDHKSRDEVEEMDKAINELEELLETRYLRYCDPSQPLQLMTMLVARCSLNVGRFAAHHPRRWGNEGQTLESERQYVWDVGIKLLEQHDMMQSTRQLQRFSWHVPYFLHWHSFIHILDTLRANPLMQDCEIAWDLVEAIFENNQDIVKNTKKPLNVAVGSLCLKAWTAREAALAEHGNPVTRVPEYIIQLREQREIAKARQNRRKNLKSTSDASNKAKPASEKLIGDSHDKKISLEQNTSLQHTETHLPHDLNTGNAYWSTSEFEVGLLGFPGSMVDMDANFMLAQDVNPEGAVDQFPGWTYWDALLADSNMSHVSSDVNFNNTPVQPAR